MIEVREYGKAELSTILNTNNRQGMLRKLDRWGIFYDAPRGRGNDLIIPITGIADRFKVYCITELGFNAGADFHKVRDLYYYLLNDDEFLSLPDEVKEYRLDADPKSQHISRQTIAGYTNKLINANLLWRDNYEYIYYFAYKHTQRIVERKEYLSAWHEYWSDIDSGLYSAEAIFNMRVKYGGIARKQAKTMRNVFYLKEINILQDLIQESQENEIEE
jgi:hypothetical protein